MKKIIFSLVTLLVMGFTPLLSQKSFYDFKAETIDGGQFNFSDLKGKKVMIVNTASKCIYTPQYKDLELLNVAYGGDKFVIIAFPANDFMSQEPGSNAEIKSFCTGKYGVTFPVMAKISVKGKEMHPLYQWLTQKSKNGIADSEVMWNFQKYLIDENGNLVGYFKSDVNPLSHEVILWVTKNQFTQKK